jgi:M6 family metalloprotease-like protein
MCFLFLVAIFATFKMYAVPAYPHPIEVRQPDGTVLTITLKGDEFASWAESSDGYTLLRNSNGFWEYAQKNVQGDLALSGRIAKNIQYRNASDKAFLSQISKKIGFSSSQATAFQQIRKLRQQALNNAPQRASLSNTVRMPVILVDFPNISFTRTKSEFQLLYNQLNYIATADGAITGSVRDYFKASSYDQLDVQFDVYGPFRMSQNIIYYDDESGGGPRLMAQEAANAAYAAGCDFSLYDRDNDGIVDGMHIIYAGYDQAAGEPAGQGIWAHAWGFSPALYLNGKYVYLYSCSSELRWNSQDVIDYPSICANKITHIGVICHELSHVFGLPDLYDTDYAGSGGQSVDLGKWCLMASGNWNGGVNESGATPALHSAWCRNQLGWIPMTELTNPADVTIPNPATQGASYKVTTTTPNEYFLLENRQQQGFDQYIPASGLLIYHVDENYISSNIGSINADPTHRGLYVKQAGGNATSTTANRATDPYPQGANNLFTDTSVPASISWAGVNANKPVTNITHNTTQKTIAFQFMGGAPPLLVIDPGATETLTESEFYGDIIFQANDDDGVGQLIIESGELTVTGVVKLEKTITKHGDGTKKWHVIGFPFDVASIRCDLVPYDLVSYEDGVGGDFWLSTVNDEGNFVAVEGVTTLTAGKGYAIQFPNAIANFNKVVTFTSGTGVTLSNDEDIISSTSGYAMIASPSVAEISLSCPPNQHFYLFDGKLTFEHNEPAARALNPFECLVVYTGASAPAKSLGIVSGPTGLININVDNGKIVDVRYYNLQGLEITQPVENSIYIVKTIYESNRVETTKTLFKK